MSPLNFLGSNHIQHLCLLLTSSLSQEYHLTNSPTQNCLVSNVDSVPDRTISKHLTEIWVSKMTENCDSLFRGSYVASIYLKLKKDLNIILNRRTKQDFIYYWIVCRKFWNEKISWKLLAQLTNYNKLIELEVFIENSSEKTATLKTSQKLCGDTVCQLSWNNPKNFDITAGSSGMPKRIKR